MIENVLEPGREQCRLCAARSIGSSEYCSVGCSLAARVPLGEMALPATWQLGVLLSSGFVLFNQWLLAGAAWIKLSQGDVDMAKGFFYASAVAGTVWIVFALLSWSVSQPKRGRDWIVFAFAALVFLAPLLQDRGDWEIFAAFAASNILIAIWLYRGVFYLWRASKNREK